MLKNKNILLGITGSIAAYKAATLARELKKRGANVQVVMTATAKEFITPLTMATLSKHPILVDFFDPTNGNWNSHVNLGLWADAYLIAPATANTIGKMANGIADNLLLTAYLSAKCPVFVAPAMDLDMYKHPTTEANLNRLRSFGNCIIEPVSGELASGLEGKGRMEEPENIVKFLEDFFAKKQSLKGKKVLLTAGPTYEKIDPVRFIGNYSSGKMGFALAEECASRGAAVTLVCGPVHLQTSHPNIKRVDVVSAEEMFAQVKKAFDKCDIAISCAAVADFTPKKEAAKSKIKRGENGLTIELKPTTDIAGYLGEHKKTQKLVGFALETDNEECNALSKLKRKNLDFIVLNSLKDKNAGFQYDTNKITIISADGEKKTYGLKPKTEVAKDIVDKIETIL